MKIAFDLDGTLYDSLPIFFEVDLALRKDLGYPNIKQEFYKSNFQTLDWDKFYSDLGIRKEHLKYLQEQFHEKVKLVRLPNLIPNAKETLEKTEQMIGHENIYIITNEKFTQVKKRFEKDGLMSYLDRIDNPPKGKAKELYRLAVNNNSCPVYYVGDLISDGMECKKAIDMGASNLRFCGIVHPYAFSIKEKMQDFVNENKTFSRVIENLEELNYVLNDN
jgi:FMN phosphatase YigB (HAD superfamily)